MNLTLRPFLLLLLFLLFSCDNKQVSVESTDGHQRQVQHEVLKINKKFGEQVDQMLRDAPQTQTADQRIKQFKELRATYKQMEWCVEYFLPSSARFINGPAIPDIELAEHTVLEPEGLQVIEEIISDEENFDQKEYVRQLKLLQNKHIVIETNLRSITMSRSQIFDALRMEVFRITTLGMAGFDTPILLTHLEEASHSLNAVQKVLHMISADETNVQPVTALIQSSVRLLQSGSKEPFQFEYFNFIKNQLNPLAEAMLKFQAAEKIAPIKIKRAIRADAPHLFSEKTFDADAFAPGTQYYTTAQKVSLGKDLFNDPLLSDHNNRSCTSCHHPSKAYTDGLAKSASLSNNPLQRNAPSLSYAALQHGQFWDMRNADLEGQSTEVISNTDEMHGTMPNIIRKLASHPTYKDRFASIYKSKTIEPWQVQNALAAFIRSLAVFNSDFDRAMRGTANSDKRLERGFNLFVGKARCATCHFLPVYNGTVPPLYSKTEQEVLGVFTTPNSGVVDEDPGRGRFHSTVESLQKSFKTPTVRNAQLTAPYMHHGMYPTLLSVMEFYNEGGAVGQGRTLAQQTLPPDKLQLTTQEMQDIIYFMEHLTDQTKK